MNDTRMLGVRMLPSSAISIIIVLLTAGTLCAGEPSASATAVLFQNLCATCHGAKGEGKQELKAPSIASLPAWYVKRQLENFQNDRRGAHAQDVEQKLEVFLSRIEKAIHQVEGGGEAVAPEPEEEEDEKKKPKLSAEDRQHLEQLFAEAKQNRSRAYFLKQELDRLKVFREYEDRFLDLFKSPGNG